MVEDETRRGQAGLVVLLDKEVQKPIPMTTPTLTIINLLYRLKHRWTGGAVRQRSRRSDHTNFDHNQKMCKNLYL